jgi:hypothetical protein
VVVLDNGEADADGEAVDGAVHEIGEAGAEDEVQDDERLGQLLHHGCNDADDHCRIHPPAVQQRRVDQQGLAWR